MENLNNQPSPDIASNMTGESIFVPNESSWQFARDLVSQILQEIQQTLESDHLFDPKLWNQVLNDLILIPAREALLFRQISQTDFAIRSRTHRWSTWDSSIDDTDITYTNTPWSKLHVEKKVIHWSQNHHIKYWLYSRMSLQASHMSDSVTMAIFQDLQKQPTQQQTQRMLSCLAIIALILQQSDSQDHNPTPVPQNSLPDRIHRNYADFSAILTAAQLGYTQAWQALDQLCQNLFGSQYLQLSEPQLINLWIQPENSRRLQKQIQEFLDFRPNQILTYTSLIEYSRVNQARHLLCPQEIGAIPQKSYQEYLQANQATYQRLENRVKILQERLYNLESPDDPEL